MAENEIMVFQEPPMPVEWDYEESVKKTSANFYSWKHLTEEIANELWIAREKLSAQGVRSDLETNVPKLTWSQYCKDIGIEKRTANRWLKRWFKEDSQDNKKIETPNLPHGKYIIIYADPPWQYDNSGFEMSAAKQYNTMSIDELKALRVDTLAHEDCCMFMWATNPLLQDALLLMSHWGFEYKTNFAWFKKRHTAGFYVYGQHELLLIGTKGSILPTGEKYKSIIYGDNDKHSKKPKIAYEIIEGMYPEAYAEETKIELFARNKRDNWTSWGNEIAK